MKKNALVLILACIGTLMQAQDIKEFVTRQIETYPQLRLLDIYKSCFQDYLGPEHLISDRAAVEAYLDKELATPIEGAAVLPYYEPCGTQGRHVRVNLSAVQQGIITKQALLDAFVRSANGKHPTVKSWAKQWRKMARSIDRMQLGLPHYAQDRAFIDSVLNAGLYAISHSPEYRNAYRPHYRIVERDIFDREMKSQLDQATQQQLIKLQTMQQNMQQVQAYLKECGAFYIATVDGDQPRVRPFGVSEIINGRLYIMTGKVKDVYKQMAANGKFEICALKPSGSEWMRLSGTLVPDETLAIKEEFLNRNPSLKRMYSADDGNMAILYITNATARFCSFAAPERKVNF
ncbi:MAG: pyridoxamine 5'-phosphate oxidase family protein [Muribaculaceae bacterium]|nr:pyridoxamine 5'-phosphate oxidase family protein [Muribaculaceae bacterium]